MKRIRIVFAVLAAAVLVPFGLLVDRALDSVALERSLQHQVVAERAFDEMERELTAFLRREEERPFEHYRYIYVPETSPDEMVELERSPLAEPAEEDFIVGYFQVEPDGTVTSPLKPEDEELAGAIGGWNPSAEIDASVERILAMVRRQWEVGSDPERRVVTKQNPGTTVNLGQETDDRFQEKVPSPQAQPTGAPASFSSQSALSELNRGAVERQERATKMTQSKTSNLSGYSWDKADDDRQTVMRPGEEEADSIRGRRRIEDAFLLDAADTVDIALEPMVGRLADGDHLLLYRTVLIEQSAYRQGLVLNIPRLVAWLSERVLVGSSLAPHARISLRQEEQDRFSEAGGGYSYRHQFAEPFAHVASVMTLAPLKEIDGSAYVVLLSVLLALVAIVGLLAVYRMVAVTVSYAERRYNFVSAVSHELKTPLTAIRMYGEMLRDGLVASREKRQHYYGVITAETERLTRLVNNVLELARLEKKDRPPAVVVGDIGPVLEETVAVLGPHLRKEGFQLQVDVEPELPPVRYDRDGLVQVLFNLVDNAVKYSRQAAKKEIILACRRRQEGDGVILTVADRGPGVPPRHISRIFDLFYRGEDELTRTSKGTGIGLALVRGLVERMGGTVSGRNAESGGFVVAIGLRGCEGGPRK